MNETDRERLRRPPFYVLVLLGIYLSYQVLGPFLVPLAWAAADVPCRFRSWVTKNTSESRRDAGAL
jgi:hypothetical protein